jgi:hypothetical protein
MVILKITSFLEGYKSDTRETSRITHSFQLIEIPLKDNIIRLFVR